MRGGGPTGQEGRGRGPLRVYRSGTVLRATLLCLECLRRTRSRRVPEVFCVPSLCLKRQVKDFSKLYRY